MSDVRVKHESSYHFPSQKQATSKKNKEWAKECIDAAEQIALYDDTSIRQNFYNKKKNYDLANDILDVNDVERVVNPYKISGASFPAKMQNYPIANPKIDLLVGEEAKRKFDFKVVAVNENAISDKEEEKQQLWEEKLREIMKSAREDMDEQEMKKELREFKKYMDYEYQDIRERRASQILNHHEKEQDFHYKFNRGFYDALIAGEEIYKCDIVAGEPVMEKCNPLNLHTIRSGDSPYIEDSDMIIEDGYKSPGQVIDQYYDYLTEKQVKDIDEGRAANSSDSFINIGEKEPDLVLDGYMPSLSEYGANDVVEVNERGARVFGGGFDEYGNIRVLKVLWKSLRKVKELKYFDEDGDEQRDIVDEYYEPDKSEGEEITNEYWINEWWEGTRIGHDIYVKIQPRPIQFRSMDNISKCSPGYVGTAYNINESKALSLMDRMKPYQYLYNVIMYRLELAMAKSKGKIGQLDLSKVPDNWSIEKWLYYAEVMGFAVVDSFKEGTKGHARGKLAGNVNNTLGSAVMDLEMGQYIQQNVQMLEYIEQQLGIISGVSEQRQGQISQREAVGNVERSVTQSAHITEKWFKTHDNVKKRVLQHFLETAKAAYKGKSKKVQYVTDDLSTSLFEIDGDELNDNEFGIFVSDASDDMELLQTMKQLAQAGIQNDKIDFSQLLDIYSTESMSVMRRKIEQSEQAKEEKEEKAQMQQYKEQQKQRQFDKKKFAAETELERKKMQEETLRNRENLRHDLTVKEMEIEQKNRELDQQEDQQEHDQKISMEDLKRQKEELEHQIQQDKEELDQQDEHHNEEMELKEEELDLKEEEIQKKEQEENNSGSDNSS